MLNSLKTLLQSHRDLTPEQVGEAIEALTGEETSAAEKAEFLVAWSAKGETAEEIAAFAQNLRGRAVPVDLHPELRAGEILDVCGTGGDRLNTFNISTSVAIVAASGGVPVAKHGNRAITSQSGSADVLEELGVRVNTTPEEAARKLKEQQFAFFFAPNYHPAFKNIGPARKLCAEKGHRTIFNFLGPLLNPARPTAQLLGVPQPELCERLAKVLKLLGTRRAMVVSGKVEGFYMDEISSLGETSVSEFYQDRGFHSSVMDAKEYGLRPATLAELRGGTKQENAEILRKILSGQDRGARREAVALNTAAALFVANKAKNITEGMELAEHLLDSGAAEKKLKELAEKS